MTLKRLIIATVVWTVLMIGAGLLGVWYIVENPVRGLRAEERAGRLGTGVAMVTAIGYAATWLPFAYKAGQKRRAAQQTQSRKKSRN